MANLFDYQAFNSGYQALWDSLDNFTPAGDSIILGQQFKRRYRFDSLTAPANDSLPKPLDKIMPNAQGQLPALAITNLGIPAQWIANQQVEWTYRVKITIWTYGWDHSYPNMLLLKVLHSFFQAKKTAALTYVKAATGYIPFDIGDVVFAQLRMGDKVGEGPMMLQSELPIALRITMNPLAL
jgi:hypothetical protein